MLPAKYFLIERLGESVYNSKIVNTGIEGFIIAALNNSRKEAIEECAERADTKLVVDGEHDPFWVADKESILSLINELK